MEINVEITKAIGLAFAVIILKYVVQTIYTAFYGPISNFPGPKLSSWSRIPSYLKAMQGQRWRWTQLELTPKYGKIWRQAPDILFVSDKYIVKEIIVHKRRLLSPAFSVKYLRSLEPLVAKCVRHLIEKLNSVINENAPNEGAVDVIGETAFGGSFNMIQNGNHPLPGEVVLELSRRIMRNLFPILKPFMKNNGYMYEFSRNLINQRRQETGTKKKDILQIILDVGEEEALSDIDIYEQINEFIIAGSDTTSFSTFFTILMLLKNPDKLSKLIEELDNEFVDLPRDEIPDHDRLKTLPYLNAVINEGMRLWPITLDGGSGRVVPEDTMINGVFFPKGILVVTNYYAMHTSSEYWGENVKEFVPERWFEPDVPRDAFYPFSAGSRNCIGQNFAWLEMRLIIVSLCRLFRFEDIPGQDHWDIEQYLTPTLAKNEYNIRAWIRS
ncbi:4524_t:CDS:10 [Paraglomus brasilianum]|uniref:4524_t:CDS:1 n=1 Tax=Paraglomus brasilianum TaxID=144538 RepID=A0A9N8VEI5_9GLOM|nr:4524_t:CDS:10 [Paraglomus brasilianum]